MDRKRNRSREGIIPSVGSNNNPSTAASSSSSSSSTNPVAPPTVRQPVVYSSIPAHLSGSATRITNPPSYQPRSYQSNGTHSSSYQNSSKHPPHNSSHQQQPIASSSYANNYHQDQQTKRKRRRDPQNTNASSRKHDSPDSESDSSSRYNDDVGHIHLRGDELIGDNCKYFFRNSKTKKFWSTDSTDFFFFGITKISDITLFSYPLHYYLYGILISV